MVRRRGLPILAEIEERQRLGRHSRCQKSDYCQRKKSTAFSTKMERFGARFKGARRAVEGLWGRGRIPCLYPT